MSCSEQLSLGENDRSSGFYIGQLLCAHYSPYMRISWRTIASWSIMRPCTLSSFSRTAATNALSVGCSERDSLFMNQSVYGRSSEPVPTWKTGGSAIIGGMGDEPRLVVACARGARPVALGGSARERAVGALF